MALDKQTLDQELSSIRSVYAQQFAGHPRTTRDLSKLDEIIGRARAVAQQAGPAGLTEAHEEAERLAKAWAEERGHVEAAQQGGEPVRQASEYMQWLRDSYQRYRRHFAGHPRSTRDLGMLAEIIEDIERRIGEIDTFLLRHADPDLAASRDRAVSNLEIYRNELTAIRSVRHAGTLDERAALIARLANDQFDRYRRHFAGKSRISRRRRLLEHIHSALSEIHTDMIALRQAGLNNDTHAKNISVVEAHLKSYHDEIGALKSVRARSTRVDRIGALAKDANAIFELYRDEFRGKPRATRSLDRIAEIWELLWPIALEMEDLAREDDSEPAGSNLRKVRDTLRNYEKEWEAIREAQL